MSISRIWLSSRNFPIERMRYTKTKQEERICNICNLNQVGDEMHYLLNCTNTKIETQRKEFFNDIKNVQPQFSHFEHINIIKYCINMADSLIFNPFVNFHHHSFNVSVPLKMGCTAPMFVLSCFLHSNLFAGSAQCLRSLLILPFHVFFGLPRPRCPTTSNSVMLLIQPSFLTTCPNQHSRLYRNKVCMLLIPSFLRRESELMWSFKRTLHVHRIIARSLRCSLSRSLTLGAQHSLAYNKTVRIYVLYICPRVMYERACEVNIGKSSRNLPHADRILVITLKSQQPPAPIVSPR